MKVIKILLLVVLSTIATKTWAQEFSLTHSGTLYSSFENPVETSYTAEKSNRFNINLLIPSLSLDFKLKGEAETALKSILFNKEISRNDINSLSGGLNKMNIRANGYLLMLKMLYTAEYQREMGLSLQFRNEGNFDLSNAALVIPFSTTVFNKGNYPNLIQGAYQNIAYWQLGLSYRENYNTKLAFGGKISFLSGAAYSKLDIYSSLLEMDENKYNLHVQGNYINSYGSASLTPGTILPNLKNPGASISLGASYLFNNKIFLTGHLKDAGIIFWNKKTPKYILNDAFSVDNLNNKDNYRSSYKDSVKKMLDRNEQTSGSFHTWTNSRIELAASKKFDSYKPVLIVSKSIIYKNDGFIALQNNYTHKAINLGFNTAYHFNGAFNIGALFMIKSPNTDFYIGTEKLLPTYYLTKGYISKNEEIGKSPTQGNIFFGLNIKFGKIMQTMPFADFVDGLNDPETGYVYRLSKKEKRNLPKQGRKKFKRRN